MKGMNWAASTCSEVELKNSSKCGAKRLLDKNG
jgi:hypothetical protein